MRDKHASAITIVQLGRPILILIYLLVALKKTKDIYHLFFTLVIRPFKGDAHFKARQTMHTGRYLLPISDAYRP